MVKYVCHDCKADNDLDLTQPIRCEKCGGRILYKKKGARVIQYVAR